VYCELFSFIYLYILKLYSTFAFLLGGNIWLIEKNNKDNRAS